jgi:hypothetical protein
VARTEPTAARMSKGKKGTGNGIDGIANGNEKRIEDEEMTTAIAQSILQIIIDIEILIIMILIVLGQEEMMITMMMMIMAMMMAMVMTMMMMVTIVDEAPVQEGNVEVLHLDVEVQPRHGSRENPI